MEGPLLGFEKTMTESLLELELTGLALTGDTGGAAIPDSGAEVDLGCLLLVKPKRGLL